MKTFQFLLWSALTFSIVVQLFANGFITKVCGVGQQGSWSVKAKPSDSRIHCTSASIWFNQVGITLVFNAC